MTNKGVAFILKQREISWFLREDATATLSDCKLEITQWDLYRGRIGRQTGTKEAVQTKASAKAKAQLMG